MDYCKHCGAPASMGEGPFRTPEIPRSPAIYRFFQRIGRRPTWWRHDHGVVDTEGLFFGVFMFIIFAFVIVICTFLGWGMISGSIASSERKDRIIHDTQEQIMVLDARLEECRLEMELTSDLRSDP